MKNVRCIDDQKRVIGQGKLRTLTKGNMYCVEERPTNQRYYYIKGLAFFRDRFEDVHEICINNNNTISELFEEKVKQLRNEQ